MHPSRTTNRRDDAVAPACETPADSRAERAARLHAAALVCDITMPWHEEFLAQDARLDEVLARVHGPGGVDMVSLTVAAVDGMHDTIRLLAKRRREIEGRPDLYRLVGSVADIRAARAEGRLAVLLHFQGTHPFERNLDLIALYYALGVRHALLVYNERTLVGDGCHEPGNAGLSVFGRLVVAEMNRVGMLVDVAHTGERTALDAIAHSAAPVMISHVTPRALFDHARNPSDDLIRAAAASGGVIGINGVGLFNGADAQTMAARISEGMAHVAGLVGPRHVALGSDFMYLEGSAYRWYYDRAYMYPAGYSEPPWLFVQPEQLPRVTEELVRRGFSDAEIVGILGENFLAMAQTVWR
ncbi:dipeptidase [Salinarimonas chemoclinalis]|uniref:dipeptidase n=1 Tax=Salinarimonas chemoclinalis TaxID=3241599 RepID=UPI0035575484